MTRFKDRLRRNEEYIPDENLPYFPPGGGEEQYYEEPPQYAPPPPSPIEEDTTPLAIAKEVRKRPSLKETLPTVIGGVPVDLHILEDYLVKTSPFALKTIIRYHNARTVEEIKGYGKAGVGVKLNSKTIILVLLCVGMAVLGLLMLTIMPELLETFSGSVP